MRTPRHAAANGQLPQLEAAAADPAVTAALQIMRRRKHSSVATKCLLATLVVFAPICWAAVTAGTPVWFQVIMITVAIALVAWLVAVMRAWAVCDKELGRISVEVQAAARTITEYRARIENNRGLRGLFWSAVAWSGLSLTVLLFLGLAVIAAPCAINGAAYLAGAGTTATFTPTSHEQSCDSKGKCSIVTDGYLDGGARHWVWHGQVPLGRSFQIREPVVQWAATVPIQSDWAAVENLVGGLLGFLAGTLLAFLLVLRVVGGRWWLYLTRRSRAYRSPRYGTAD